MNTKRLLLYIALMLVGLNLWYLWEKDAHHQPNQTMQKQAASVEALVPPVAQIKEKNTPWLEGTGLKATKSTPEGKIVTVTTDQMIVKIDALGGNIVETQLRPYARALHDPMPFTLLSRDPNALYLAESGLVGDRGPDTLQGPVTYQIQKSHYTLAPGEKLLTVPLIWHQGGISVQKIFRFTPGKYTIGVEYRVHNQSGKPWKGHVYAQLRHKKEAKFSQGFFSLKTYRGAAFYTQHKHYTKLPYKKMDEANFSKEVEGGWLALQQRYFLSAWIPDAKAINHYFSRALPGGTYTVGFVGPEVSVDPGKQGSFSSILYAGPEIVDNLKPLAKGLDLTVDYGWLWIVSVSIFWVMQHIFNVVGNWGAAIILVTLLIRLLFFKLSETSFRSMAKMKKLQPQLAALKERYGDDKQQLSKATMEIYRREKVNPLGGCLPFLIQIPFFIALYYVLVESVQLRHAPFVLWIHDLSAKDPFYVLPILMGLSMLLQQRMSPPPPDPVQAKVMMSLPLIFTAFFLKFPAGLVLYWLINNCFSIFQQWFINYRLSKA